MSRYSSFDDMLTLCREAARVDESPEWVYSRLIFMPNSFAGQSGIMDVIRFHLARIKANV